MNLPSSPLEQRTMKESKPQSDCAPLGDLNARFEDYLENCRVPLSTGEWVAFRKDLEAKRFATLFEMWIKPERERLKRRLGPSKLDEKRIEDSIILAGHQVKELRVWLQAMKQSADEVWKAGSVDALVLKSLEEGRRRAAKGKRDRKPDRPCVEKNWLEAMPAFNEGQPCGYVQATGQRRKEIELFLRRIKAKPAGTIRQKGRGRPKLLYGFGTNCRVLKEWFGAWCDQAPEAKYDLILREALLIAEVVADSKSPPDCDRLARFRRILRCHAQSPAKQIGADFDFDFLGSPAACAVQIEILRKKFPRPDMSPEALFADSIKKALAGEHGKPPA